MRKIILSAVALFALTACEDLPFEIGYEGPVPGLSGVCTDAEFEKNKDGSIDWELVLENGCIPKGLYSCEAGTNYSGDFGTRVCQGWIVDDEFENTVEIPDAFSMYIETSDAVETATLTYETDMTGRETTITLFPAPSDRAGMLLWGVHFLNPGYGSDGDKVEGVFNFLDENGTPFQLPPVTCRLDGQSEDCGDESDGTFKAMW